MARGTRRLAKFAAGAGAGVGILAPLRRRPARRAQLRRAATGIHDTILPPEPDPTAPVPLEDEAHAPGHRHLPSPEDEAPPSDHEHPGTQTVVDHRPGHVHKG